MNVNVIVSVFEAPGLDYKKKNNVSAALAYFQGMNQKISVDLTQTVGAADLFTKASVAAPDSVKRTLIFLRMKCNGNVLDLTKTFTEQKVKEGSLIKIDVLVN